MSAIRCHRSAGRMLFPARLFRFLFSLSMSLSSTSSGARSPRALPPHNPSSSSESAQASLPPPPPYSEKDPADTSHSAVARASASRRASNAQKASKASSGTDTAVPKRKVPALKLRAIQASPSPLPVPISPLGSHAEDAPRCANGPSESPVALGNLTSSEGPINPSSRTRAHRQTADLREEQVKRPKKAQSPESEGVSTGDDVIGLWRICREKLQLKAEEISVTEKLLHELSGAEISAMNTEGLIDLIGFLSRTISPGDYRHFRAVLSQLDKHGEVLQAALISPFFFMLMHAIGQFDVSKSDDENAVTMAPELTLMSSYLHQPYGLTRAYQRALQVREAESASSDQLQMNADREASPRGSTKKSGSTLRRSMVNLFVPKSEPASSADEAPKSPRSEAKDKKSGSAYRRSFNLSSAYSTTASSSPRGKDATDEYTPGVGTPSLSPRIYAGTVTTAMLQPGGKKQSSTTTPATLTNTSPPSSTATEGSAASPRRVLLQSATMSPRRKPLPGLFEDRGPSDGQSNATDRSPRVMSPRSVTTREPQHRRDDEESLGKLAAQSLDREKSTAGDTPLAKVLALFRSQRDAFVMRADLSRERAEEKYAVLSRFLVHLEPSLTHATQASDVYRALRASGLTYEEMLSIQTSCTKCHGWFGTREEARQLETILQYVPLYIGRFKKSA